MCAFSILVNTSVRLHPTLAYIQHGFILNSLPISAISVCVFFFHKALLHTFSTPRTNLFSKFQNFMYLNSFAAACARTIEILMYFTVSFVNTSDEKISRKAKETNTTIVTYLYLKYVKWLCFT